MAEWGYVTVIRGTPAPLPRCDLESFTQNVQFACETLCWAERENNGASSPLHGKIDMGRVGMAGHSLGGAVAHRAALVDPRIKAVVSLDAVYEYTGSPWLDLLATQSPPTLLIAGGSGGYCTYALLETDTYLIDILPAPAAQITIQGADHVDFSSVECVLGHCLCPVGFRSEIEVRAAASRYMVSWFNVHLKGLTEEFEGYISGAIAEADEESGLTTRILNYTEP